MTPKLSQRQRTLKKSVLRQIESQLNPNLSQKLPWLILGKLTSDQTKLPDDLKHLLTEVIDQKSISGYMELQSFADPQKYGSAAEYFSAAKVLSFLKKYPFGKVAGLDPLDAALKKSVLAEKLCRITNRRLRWYRFRGYRHSNRWQGLHSIFHTARLYIASWLGPLDLNQIYDYTRHGPGGALGVTGSDTTAYFKYAATSYTVTTRALPYAEAAILADPLWRRYVVTGGIIGDSVPTVSESREAVLKRLKVVNHNKVTFVPKTAQTHRAIAIEPLMNIFLQLGVGNLLKEKLSSVGCNLRSQARNQTLAWKGSDYSGDPFDRPVTIDLSMASDTVSFELVKELIPEEWFNLLSDLRSPNGLLDGVERPWAKFSSMGNGFTFELETMIFLALARSVAKHLGCSQKEISVYGDDIIVPAGMALRLIDVLAYSGFRINTEKSFLFGPFRESCGMDFFQGRNVRPFFLKRKIQNAKDLVFVHNSLAKIDSHSNGYLNDLHTEHNTCQYIRRFIASEVNHNLLGPVTEDLEGHLFSHLDEAMTSAFVKWDINVQQWSYATASQVPRLRSGAFGPLFLQMMDGCSFGRSVPSGSLSGFGQLAFLIDCLGSNFLANEPVRKSKVSRRKHTKLVLATRTSNGWRND